MKPHSGLHDHHLPKKIKAKHESSGGGNAKGAPSPALAPTATAAAPVQVVPSGTALSVVSRDWRIAD